MLADGSICSKSMDGYSFILNRVFCRIFQPSHPCQSIPSGCLLGSGVLEAFMNDPSKTASTSLTPSSSIV